ncbi:hypothetical protein EC991_009099 [Linnemannia zychae]|nr:hypothetical protein EC991_009099 [Linnemannia zychae]
MTDVCKQLKALYNPLVWRHIESNEWIRGQWERSFRNSMESGALKKHAQHIQSLRLEFDNSSILHKFINCSPPTYPHLTSIEISDVYEEDELIAKLIDTTSAGLKRFVIHNEVDGPVNFGSNSTLSLLRNAATLEVVRMDSAAHFESRDIQRLLCSAPNLKELTLLGSTRPEDTGDGNLEALDMVKSEWVCRNLEVFACEIGGIPRPDITREINDEPADELTVEGTREESLDLQRRVYSQLGKLTKLRKLKLGSPQMDDDYSDDPADRDYGRLVDCLAMTLDSGLGLLKDLKELKRVELDGMEVYIGPKELAWMRGHWPELKTLSYEVIEG